MKQGFIHAGYIKKYVLKDKCNDESSVKYGISTKNYNIEL
jgi:hypothetical protein